MVVSTGNLDYFFGLESSYSNDLLTSDGAGPLSQMQEEERRQWVKDSIAKLPETLRQTLVLAYYQDLKYREIADILKIPVGTVKSRLHAAINKLAEMGRAGNLDDNGSTT